MQAQSINKLIPDYDESINFDYYADSLAIQDRKFNELRVTIIDKNWNVIGDSFVDTQDLYLLENHSPETRIEIQDALNNTYGSTIRTSESTGLDLIYVAIQRDPADIDKGLVRVALPFDIWDSFFNFFIYPFLVLFFLVIASSSFLSLNVEYTLRRDLDSLLKSTRKAIKGQNISELNSGDEQLSTLSNAVRQIAERLNLEVEQAIEQRTEFGTVLDSMNQGVIIFNKSQLNQKPKFTDFDGYFELDVSDDTKEIFIRYPKYKEIKITISDSKNLGEIILFKRGCKNR